MTSARVLVLGVTAIVLLATPALAQGPEPIASVTLDEALRRSEIVNPSVVSARGQVRSAELGVRSAKVQFLPQLTLPLSANLQLSSGQSRVDPITGSVVSGNRSEPSFSFGAQANWTLFDGFGRSHDLGAARARETAADAGLISSRYNALLQTTNSFFDALANQELLRVNEAAVERAEEQLKVASARLQTGAGQRTDSLTALVQLGQARQQLLQARANLATAEANLGRLVGSNGRVRAVDDSSFYDQPALLDTAGIRRETLLSAPAMRTVEANLAASQASLRAQKSDYWPTLSVQAANSWTANKGNDYALEPRRSLLVQLSISPWTSLQRETNIENQAIQVDNAIAQVADTRRQIEAQLTQYFAALGNAQEAIEVAQTSVLASQENVRVANQRYLLGVTTIVELMQIQEQLTQAQVSEVQARFSYLRAKAQIEAVIGRSL